MTRKYSRREALELGIGAAVLSACGPAAASIETEQTAASKGVNPMTSLSDWNKYGEELRKCLILRTSPIAAKMLEKETDIPKEAIRPKKDRGYHIAQCQAFAFSRRDGTTVAMPKEDHWCPTALIA